MSVVLLDEQVCTYVPHNFNLQRRTETNGSMSVYTVLRHTV